MLLWAIHDFLKYDSLGGFSHQGYGACPWCGKDLWSEHSTKLGKCTNGGTWRWLLDGHPLRLYKMKDHFNGLIEEHAKLQIIIVEELMQNAVECEVWRALGNRDGAPRDPSKVHGVKQMSSLHRLLYWKVR
jgi:hypothetical protein